MLTILTLMLIGAVLVWVWSFIFSSNTDVKKRCMEAGKAVGEAAADVGIGCLSFMFVIGLVVIVQIVLLVRSCS